MSHRDWFHWQWESGIDALSSFSDDHGATWLAGSFTERVTVLRTRLALWAWWASNDYPQPGPAQVRFPLRAKIQYGDPGGGDFPPPPSWPADPGIGEDEKWFPTVYSTLELRAQTYRPPDPVAGTPQVFYGWAEIPAAAGDSAAQRRFNGTNRLAAWLAVAQGTTDWGDSYGGADFFTPFYFNASLSVLYEYDG